ncbi:MAG: hypothetical protein MUD06_04295 [Rhodospirillales bacterium]|nr:hypothetical protein [Rhodospirillales bacterium]
MPTELGPGARRMPSEEAPQPHGPGIIAAGNGHLVLALVEDDAYGHQPGQMQKQATMLMLKTSARGRNGSVAASLKLGRLLPRSAGARASRRRALI